MRFKELRGLALGLLLLGLDIAFFIYSLMIHNQLKLMLTVFLSLIIVINLLSQFYIRVLNDSIFYYRFAFIALLPQMIEIKDITDVELSSKHHLIMKTSQSQHHLYVWNGQKLQELLLEKIQKHSNETK